MQIQRITNPSGIDDIKLIAETNEEKIFINQLSDCGTLIATTSSSTNSIVFRATSMASDSDVDLDLLSRGKIGKFDFNLRQNSNFNVDLKFQTDTDPIDLTTYNSIKLQVKIRKSSGALITLSVGSGLVISGVDNNILSVSFTPAMTKVLCDNEYYYDIMMSKPNSNDYLVEGKINVETTVTE